MLCDRCQSGLGHPVSFISCNLKGVYFTQSLAVNPFQISVFCQYNATGRRNRHCTALADHNSKLLSYLLGNSRVGSNPAGREFRSFKSEASEVVCDLWSCSVRCFSNFMVCGICRLHALATLAERLRVRVRRPLSSSTCDFSARPPVVQDISNIKSTSD